MLGLLTVTKGMVNRIDVLIVLFCQIADYTQALINILIKHLRQIPNGVGCTLCYQALCKCLREFGTAQWCTIRLWLHLFKATADWCWQLLPGRDP